MAIKLKLRGPDGRYVKGDVKHLEGSMTAFGSKVIKQGRAILNSPGTDGYHKRTQSNTLFKDYHYTMKSSSSTITFGFEFGGASDYWQFVDQGVQGVGYSEAKSDGGKKGKRGRTGIARGVGSPFRFKYDYPTLRMREAIKFWISNKPVSLQDSNRDSAAWAIGYSIKRRGLERTMFYSIPVSRAIKTLPKEVLEAFRIDVGTLMHKLPNKIIMEEKMIIK